MKDYLSEIEELKAQQQFRQIPKIDAKEGKFLFCEGRRLLNLSSNDYLGFGYDKNLVKEFLDFAKTQDDVLLSSASARLLSGNHRAFDELEDYIAKLFNKEQCLLFNSGYHANVGIVSALCKRGCAIFSDKLNHASIIDGMKLADGDFYRYRHLDYAHLESLLAKKSKDYDQLIIFSETVFSMDGDLADVEKLIEIKKKFGAILILDEAHGFGVFGEKGCGASEGKEGVDLIMATFGKALGSYGAFAVGNKTLIEYLTNKARSFIFSTAIPPISAMWSLWLLQNKLPHTKESRKNLLALAEKFRAALRLEGLKTDGSSHIVPIIIGDNDKTVKIAENLRGEGFLILPIRPPTVPIGTSRLRLSLNTLMREEDILQLPKLVKKGLE